MINLYLQMFAEGGEGEAATTADTGVKGFDSDAAIEDYRESKKPGGKAFNAGKYQTAEAPIVEQTPAAIERPTFKDLIKGDYKAEADEYIQKTIQDRLKSSKEAEKTLKTITPAIQALMKQRELDEGDMEGFVKSVLEDESLYEEEALRQGVPVENVMQIKNLQRIAEESQAKLEQIEAETKAAAYVQGLLQQGEELKMRYPNFDLHEEMQNEKFREFVTGPADMSLEDAYWVIHRQELLNQTAGAVSQRTKSDVSRSIQSGLLRPTESASRTGGQTPQVSLDPRSLTSDQIRELKDRARRGEKISF